MGVKTPFMTSRGPGTLCSGPLLQTQGKTHLFSVESLFSARGQSVLATFVLNGWPFLMPEGSVCMSFQNPGIPSKKSYVTGSGFLGFFVPNCWLAILDVGVSKNRGTPKSMVYSGNHIKMDDVHPTHLPNYNMGFQS